MRTLSLEEALTRAHQLADAGERRLLGICGPPGGGKSTLAGRIVEQLGDRARLVGMDGFHLAQTELARLGRAERKGAVDTFDTAGYIALLRRLREASEELVYAPGVPARDRGADRRRRRGRPHRPARGHGRQLPARRRRRLARGAVAARRGLVRRDRRGHPRAMADRTARPVRHGRRPRRARGCSAPTSGTRSSCTRPRRAPTRSCGSRSRDRAPPRLCVPLVGRPARARRCGRPRRRTAPTGSTSTSSTPITSTSVLFGPDVVAALRAHTDDVDRRASQRHATPSSGRAGSSTSGAGHDHRPGRRRHRALGDPSTTIHALGASAGVALDRRGPRSTHVTALPRHR